MLLPWHWHGSIPGEGGETVGRCAMDVSLYSLHTSQRESACPIVDLCVCVCVCVKMPSGGGVLITRAAQVDMNL